MINRTQLLENVLNMVADRANLMDDSITAATNDKMGVTLRKSKDQVELDYKGSTHKLRKCVLVQTDIRNLPDYRAGWEALIKCIHELTNQMVDYQLHRHVGSMNLNSLRELADSYDGSAIRRKTNFGEYEITHTFKHGGITIQTDKYQVYLRKGVTDLRLLGDVRRPTATIAEELTALLTQATSDATMAVLSTFVEANIRDKDTAELTKFAEKLIGIKP